VNFAPAVVEASQGRVPLIVLTADRPPELRDIGANQTIDQSRGLYGTATKWFAEMLLPGATDAAVRHARLVAARAVAASLEGAEGPVHLNFPLREPLVLSSPLQDDDSGRPDGRPWVRRVPVPPPPAAALAALPARGIVVAGRHERDRWLGPAAARFAERAGYPLLADPLSGARHGPAAIAHYDVLLRDERFALEMQPELVIRIGDLPTSKPLRTWLGSLHRTEQVALDPEAAWQDPASVVSVSDPGEPAAALEAHAPETPADPDWLAAWRRADDETADTIAQTLGDELSEPLVARSLGEWLPSDATLFVASSMPIRDVELFFAVRELAPHVVSNRGANGIDGTVSSAFGAAAVSDGPVVLLIGDVALAHDIGGLLAARRLDLAITIVLLNNDGGGIFHFLPVAAERDGFEQHVATPHGLDFSHAAALYGLDYERPVSIDQLRHAIDAAVSHHHTTIVEVRTDREHNLALHRRVADAVARR
jgi:2-succinyl-5-enolpyruvyl-6-hydroxy-3-cyclohexene-1-carboxylate synthase